MGKHQGTIVARSRCQSSKSASGTVFMLFFPDHGVGQPAAEASESNAATVISEQMA
jgi:hypothetical protein